MSCLTTNFADTYDDKWKVHVWTDSIIIRFDGKCRERQLDREMVVKLRDVLDQFLGDRQKPCLSNLPVIATEDDIKNLRREINGVWGEVAEHEGELAGLRQRMAIFEDAVARFARAVADRS